MPISPDILNQVRGLIALLRSHDPMTEAARRRLADEYSRRQISELLKTGQTFGESSGFRGMVGPARSHDEFREKLRSIDNDLGEQTRIVREGVEEYFKTGMMPAPYYAWRIAIVLRRAKEFSVEADFLESFSAHFQNGLGRRYQRIAERAPKARALADRNR